MLAVALPIIAGILVWNYANDPARKPLSPDCVQVHDAILQWGRVMPDISNALSADARTQPTLARDTADAAAAVRRTAAAVDDPTVRRKVTALADALDKVSRGNPSSPPNNWPDQNFMGGHQGALAAVHDLAEVCPNINDEKNPPPDVAPMPEHTPKVP